MFLLLQVINLQKLKHLLKTNLKNKNMSVIHKKSLWTKMSYNIGSIELIALLAFSTVFTILLIYLNQNLILIFLPLLILFASLFIIAILSKTQIQGRWVLEMILSYFSFFKKNKEVIDPLEIKIYKNYIKINKSYKFGFQLFVTDQKSNEQEYQDINEHSFARLINNARYKLQFKTHKNIFDNTLFNQLGLSFNNSTEFNHYQYYLYVTVYRKEDIPLAKKQIITNLNFQYQELNEEELLKIN